MIRVRLIVLLLGWSVSLVGCGTFTGIPSHGGGKRFAIEQELISASARAVAKSLNVRPLAGKRCALYVISIGDEGAGNLVGGRYSWEAAIRGEYLNSPATETSNKFPVIDTTTTSTTAGVTTTTDSENAINYPSETRTHADGATQRYSAGVTSGFPPGYRAEAFINPKDSQFLKAVIHEALALRGVLVVPPERADVDVYATVDVFGTVRSRTDWHLYNVERLVGKTALQMVAFDRERNVVLDPVTASYEAEYLEKYIFWMGPVATEKQVRPSDDLLVDFRWLPRYEVEEPVEEEAPSPGPPPTPEQKTRTKPETVPETSPDVWRPEDVGKTEQ